MTKKEKLKTYLVVLPHLTRLLLADDVYQVSPGLEGRDGGEVWSARVHEAAPEDTDAAALTLVQFVREFRHHGLDL